MFVCRELAAEHIAYFCEIISVMDQTKKKSKWRGKCTNKALQLIECRNIVGSSGRLGRLCEISTGTTIQISQPISPVVCKERSTLFTGQAMVSLAWRPGLGNEHV